MEPLTVATHADGFGRWHARVIFPHTLSESDPRPAFNLDAQWARIRRAARAAIVREITDRERGTRESCSDAAQRVRASLGRLVVTGQDIDGQNRWHGVTLSEPR